MQPEKKRGTAASKADIFWIANNLPRQIPIETQTPKITASIMRFFIVIQLLLPFNLYYILNAKNFVCTKSFFSIFYFPLNLSERYLYSSSIEGYLLFKSKYSFTKLTASSFTS